MSRLYGLVETEVADDLIDFDDDVLGDLGLHRFAIDHLDKGDALVIGLCDRYLTKYLEFVGNDDADQVTWYIRLPCVYLFQGNGVTLHDDWFKRFVAVDTP